MLVISVVLLLFAILQMYEFSSKSQLRFVLHLLWTVVCDTANVRVFKQITTPLNLLHAISLLFAILQMYEFSSKSQLPQLITLVKIVVCDTANVRVFKQITTCNLLANFCHWLFAILQMYEFSSKSQHLSCDLVIMLSCLRYCKCTSFQANHNT